MAQIIFTTPIAFEPLVGASITQAAEVDDTLGRIVVELEFEHADGSRHPRRHRLAVTNGRADGLDGNLRSIELTEGMEQAFNAVMGGYIQGGKSAMLSAMVALGILPPGSVG